MVCRPIEGLLGWVRGGLGIRVKVRGEGRQQCWVLSSSATVSTQVNPPRDVGEHVAHTLDKHGQAPRAHVELIFHKVTRLKVHPRSLLLAQLLTSLSLKDELVRYLCGESFQGPSDNTLSELLLFVSRQRRIAQRVRDCFRRDYPVGTDGQGQREYCAD